MGNDKALVLESRSASDDPDAIEFKNAYQALQKKGLKLVLIKTQSSLAFQKPLAKL